MYVAFSSLVDTRIYFVLVVLKSLGLVSNEDTVLRIMPEYENLVHGQLLVEYT